MAEWIQPRVTEYLVDELAKRVRVRAYSSYDDDSGSFGGFAGYPSNLDQNINFCVGAFAATPACLVEVCWYGASCDAFPIL